MSGPFAVKATSNTGVAFELDAVVEGVSAWSDSEHKLTNVPAHILGGTLVQTRHGKIPSGTTISLSAPGDGEARAYVAVELEGPRKKDCAALKGRDGGLLPRLAAEPIWSGEAAAPSWCGDDSILAMFSAPLCAGGVLELPQVTEPDAVIVIVVVPIFKAAFTATLTCSGDSKPSAVPMEEGAKAWWDRDHRFADVPSYLLGGTLFQGSHKDVPENTMFTARPNAKARVYVLLDLAGSGGLQESLPARGWRQETGAPRWHGTASMVAYSRPCGAGCALPLPPTQGSQATFSVVVVPDSSAPAAAMEVSASVPGGERVPQLEFATLEEGTAAWLDESHTLFQVPEWMQGATIARGAHAGPPSGALFAVRLAAPSVVYAVVEQELHNRPGRSGGLLPDALLTDGWERRDQAPEWKSGSKLAVFAKRAAARQPVCLPPFSDEGAVFALVAKTDAEAFDVTLETSDGLEYDKVKIEETMLVWNDSQNRLAWIPKNMTGGTFLRGPQTTPRGTRFCLHGSTSFRAFVIVEADHEHRPPLSGGFPDLLPREGWREESAPPSWGDKSATTRVFSKKVVEGSQVLLPASEGDALLVMVAVSLTSSPDRLADELKQVFRAWDAQGKGGVHKEDLRALLGVLCPGVDQASCEALLAQGDRAGVGALSYEEFVDRVVAASGA